jgi:hypothetical protein
MNDVAILESGNDLMSSTAATGTQELFVINLCASMTPMPAVPKNLKGFEKYKLYQVSRQEDGRRRFRLRLGFFTSETDAEWVLNSVRNLYPAAFTGCVTAEDQRYLGDAFPAARVVTPTAPAVVAAPVAVSSVVAPAKPVISRPVAPPTVVTPSASVAAAPAKATAAPAPVAALAPAAKPAAPAAAISKPVVAAPSIKPEPAKPAAVLSASTPAATPQPAVDAKSHGQPFHVGRGVELPDIDLELTDEYETLSAPYKPTLPPTAPQVKQPTAVASRVAHAANAANGQAPGKPYSEGPIRSASIISPPKIVDDYVPILDTTLTIRTLTKTEADDPNLPKWFAVQLALSEQPINLDTMPKLDIFAAYTLYCVATMEGGTVKHALRLGFFRESVSAEAVMGYLKAFFNQPTINQISTAEFDRFGDSQPTPKPMAPTEGKVVNLGAKRPGGPVKPLVPIAVQQPAARPIAKPLTPNTTRITAPPARPQSFLSRLIGRQLD